MFVLHRYSRQGLRMYKINEINKAFLSKNTVLTNVIKAYKSQVLIFLVQI